LLADDSAGQETFLVVLDQILKALPSPAPAPVTVVFDDVHLCDESPLSRALLRHLLAQAPAKMQFILAARRNLGTLFTGVNNRSQKVFLDNESLALGPRKLPNL